MSTKGWYTRVDLSHGLQLRITDPAQYHILPFVIKDARASNIRLCLSQEDAIKVLRALMQAYPLEALANIE